MKTARFLGNKKIGIEEKDKPKAGKGQVVIKVKSCGLCGSERGDYINGFVHQQGHEVSGIVDQAGEGVTNVKQGDRVVVYLTSFCGTCEYCKQGLTTMCINYPQKENIGWASPGGFAEYLVTNAQNALPLDDELSFEDGVLLLDTLGTPYHGLRLAHAEQAKTALVIGCGTVGLGAVLVLKALGVQKVYASDMSDFRLGKAKELGAIALKASEVNVIEYIRKETGIGADIVVEAVGNPFTLTQGIKAVKFGGTVLGLGEQPENFALTIDFEMRLKDLITIRSWYFPVSEYYENMKLMKEGFFKNKDMLVTHRFSLDDMQTACDMFYSGVSLKTLINF